MAFNRGLTEAQFQRRIARVGLAVNEARFYYYGHAGSFHDVIDTMVLFGDPALRLRLPDPLLAGSTLESSRAWAAAGQPITVTATLTNSGAVSTTGQLTLTLPPELGAPVSLGATSSVAQYDPVGHRVLWSGVVTPTLPEAITFTSLAAEALSACGQATVTGEVEDGLAARTPLATALQLATPDVDCDGDVDIVDIQQVTAAWGAAQGDPLYHPRYDLDGDDAIGALDIVIVAAHWQ